MAKRRALLMVKMDGSATREAEWNDWYNNVHVGARLSAPGFLFIRRYKIFEVDPTKYASHGASKYLALYDLESTDALSSPEYLEIRKREAARPPDSFEAITKGLPSSRGVYDQVFPETADYRPPNARYLQVGGHEVPRHVDKEYNAWYNTDHVPSVMKVPGFVVARRFKLAKGDFGTRDAPQYLSLYDLDRAPIVDAEVKKATGTPWTVWMQTKYERKIRAMYERIFPKSQ